MDIKKILSYFSLIPDWVYDYTFLILCCYGADHLGYTDGYETAYSIYSINHPWEITIPKIGV